MKIKRKYIKKLAIDNNLKLLIETGTYFGQSTKYFAKYFERVYTIELSEELFNYTKKHNSASNIQFYQGNSSEKLKEIINDLATSATFFLDAHASGGVTVSGEIVSPVRIELGILEKFKFLRNSLIIIDDARGFDGTNSYPSYTEIQLWAKKSNMGRVYIELDMIVIEPVIVQ